MCVHTCMCVYVYVHVVYTQKSVMLSELRGNFQVFISNFYLPFRPKLWQIWNCKKIGRENFWQLITLIIVHHLSLQHLADKTLADCLAWIYIVLYAQF